MAALTLSVPVKEDFLRKIDKAAESESSSREDVVNKAIDAYLRRKELNEYFSFCGNWAKENNYSQEEFREDMRQYYAAEDGETRNGK